MKTKFLHLLALIAFLQLGVAIQASAQDGLPNPELNGYPNAEVNPYEDKPLLYEHDLKTNRVNRDSTSSSTSRSSSTTPSTHNKSKATGNSTESRKPSNSRGDDPLNFNFLYYIIHKFKSSDLIDQ